MHDPRTMIWGSKLLDVWHEDPEVDGTDDSCGWFLPPLQTGDRELAHEMAEWETKFPCYFHDLEVRPADAVARVYSAFAFISRRLERRDLRPQDLLYIFSLGAIADDNLARWFRVDYRKDDPDCPRMAGWSGKGPPCNCDLERLEGAFCLLIRHWRRMRRPWWRHPSWHIRHWRINIHLLRQMMRWLWTRCAACGQRFRFGESPYMDGWRSGGPRWGRGEKNAFHRACTPHAIPDPSEKSMSHAGAEKPS